MPGRRGADRLKDPELYEALRDDGASKEKAARISNAAARDGRPAVGRRGGKAGDYEDWTVKELRARAKELGLTGYSGQRKAELIDMLRNH
ncbi:MAG TPA: Rho termination factor N-terminal domain-containing protein [Microbacteriaceae bacterium]|nr:Rho termination factor N-terminal domain-containing protein [Microbacteriaceae bacterium]